MLLALIDVKSEMRFEHRRKQVHRSVLEAADQSVFFPTFMQIVMTTRDASGSPLVRLCRAVHM
jgi:hypothetical protein